MAEGTTIWIPQRTVEEFEHLQLSSKLSLFVKLAIHEKIDRERRDILARGLEVVSDEKAEVIE